MIAEILALLAALAFAFSTVSIRKGLDRSNPFSATLVIAIIGALIFWVLVPIAVPLDTIDLNGILLFFAAGTLVPGFAMLLYIKGMEKLGASINGSLVATYPMISTLIAIFLLGEHPTVEVWIGMLIVISGIVLVEKSTAQDTATKVTKSALVYPLVTTCLAGSGFAVRKMALNLYSEPVMGVATGYLASLIIYLSLSFHSKGFQGSKDISNRTFQVFWKGGLYMGFGQLLSLYALRYGDVSIVAPMLNIEPLFILLLAHLFLKKLEKLSSLLIVGTVMVVTGISLITII